MNPQNIAENLNPTGILMAYHLVERKHARTPLIPFGTVHRDGFSVEIYAKMDTLNPGGSFKDRGSFYFVSEAIRRGIIKEGDSVVTASAGNHAKGVAKAAEDFGLKAIIYMAQNTPQKKIEGTKKYGAEVRLVEGDYHDAAKIAVNFANEHSLTYIPAFEDSDIIIGQSTVVTESMMQLYDQGIRPDFFVFPYGGGGLTNGGGFAARHFDETEYFRTGDYGSKTLIYGVQAQNFNTMFRSFKAEKILEYEPRGETIADGIRVSHASEQMLNLTLRYIDDMFDVSEQQIRDSIRTVYNSDLLHLLQEDAQLRIRMGFHRKHGDRLDGLNVVEGAAAAAFACVFADDKIPYEHIAETIHPRKNIVGVVIASGNNIDPQLLEEIISEKS